LRKLLCVLPSLLFLVTFSASAQEERHTDARQDGLLGPVRSVHAIETRLPGKWQQPGGLGLMSPVRCRDCTYDPDGTKTSSGQIVNGEFHGNLTELRRDGNGNVTDRVVTEAITGKVIRHEVMGPYGKTAETDFDTTTGNVGWQQTFAYDQFGYMQDWLSLDGDGKQESHVVTSRLKDGTVTQQSVWGKNGQLSYQQTYDPEREITRFTVWAESGEMNLTYTYAHGKVISFWERPGLPHERPQFGEDFSDSGDKVNITNYHCHENGQCDLFHVHREYLDPAKKRNPTTIELRDSSDTLIGAAYIEYELDSFGNWLHRKVYVYPSEQGDRALREEDSRTITYWEK